MKTDYKGIIIPDYLIAMKWIDKKGKCMADLHRELNITYKHLHELKHTFLELNWIRIEKEERKHIMHLTMSGMNIVKITNELLSAMSIQEEDIIRFIEEGKLKKTEKINVKELKELVEKDDNY